MKKIIGLLAGLAMLGSAHAAVVTYNFTATVAFIGESSSPTNPWTLVDLTTLTGMTVAAGQEIHGSFSYDTAMGLDPVYQPPPESSGTYMIYSDPNNNTKVVAPGVLTPPQEVQYETNLMEIANNATTFAGGDFFWLSHYVMAPDNSGSRSIISLTDFGGAAFDHGGVPASLTLSISSLDYARYTMTYYLATGGYVNIWSNLTSLTPATAVPEPETYAMLLAGIALLGWQARKRARAYCWTPLPVAVQ